MFKLFMQVKSLSVLKFPELFSKTVSTQFMNVSNFWLQRFKEYSASQAIQNIFLRQFRNMKTQRFSAFVYSFHCDII